jgi:hypothetical protein
MTVAHELFVRNIARILHYPRYTLLGAGEGDLGRFPADRPFEIHSAFGTVLFSYGIPGVTLFVAALLDLWRSLRPALRWHLVALLGYSFSHDGLRFSFAWIVVGLLAGMADDPGGSGYPRHSRATESPPWTTRPNPKA